MISCTQSQTSGNVHLNCMVCGRCERLLTCSQCKTAVYCSKKHQKLDWKQHKPMCLMLSSGTSSAASSTQCAISSQVLDLKKKSEFIVTKATNLTNNSNLNEIISKEPLPGPSVDRFRECPKSTDGWMSPITSEDSSEAAILGATAESLNPRLQGQNEADMPTHQFNGVKDFSQLGLSDNKSDETTYEKIKGGKIFKVCKDLIEDMDTFGMHFIERFMGEELGLSVLAEVLHIYSEGLFKDGKLVSNRAGANDSKNIRGDQIAWLNGKEKKYPSIGLLVSQIDNIIIGANKMHTNGKLGAYTINERTGVMLACYPGNGAHYVTHVDNPHGDGRCITAIYYLNRNWDVNEDGGVLKIYRESSEEIGIIAPYFDRIVFFWSDNRNPHEVAPAFKTRYAITVWYYDEGEKKRARQTFQKQRERVILTENL